MKKGDILSLATLFLMLLMTGVSRADELLEEDDVVPRIVVTGEGKAHQKPDLAEINVGVVTQAATAADAVQQNNQAMQQLLDVLKMRGVAEDDLQTSGFHVNPRYQHDERGRAPTIVGYEVVNQVRVKVRQLSQLGSILDAVVQSGANRINGINFMISEPSKVLDEARREAVADARRKAKLYADTTGVQVGKPLVIEEQPFDLPQPVEGRFMAMAEARQAVPIETGEQTLRAHVRVTYELRYDE